MYSRHPRLRREKRLGRAITRTLAIPARCSSVITGLERNCRTELVGFTTTSGGLGAVLRFTDDAAGRKATAVVPVEPPALIEGTTTTIALTIPPSDVLAGELRAETESVRLTVRPLAGTLLGDLLVGDFGLTSARPLALALNAALHGGEVATS
jgi:hypothetical protein